MHFVAYLGKLWHTVLTDICCLSNKEIFTVAALSEEALRCDYSSYAYHVRYTVITLKQTELKQRTEYLVLAHH